MSPLNITQPLGIWSIKATIFGDVQYSQNGTVTNPCSDHPQLAHPKGSPKLPAMLAREPRAARRPARRTPAAAAMPQAAKAAPGAARGCHLVGRFISSHDVLVSWKSLGHLGSLSDQLGVSWDHVSEIELKIEQIWNQQSILSNPSRGAMPAMHFQNRRLQDPLFSLPVATVMRCFDLWRWMVCRFHDIWRPRGRLCSAPCDMCWNS